MKIEIIKRPDNPNLALDVGATRTVQDSVARKWISLGWAKEVLPPPEPRKEPEMVRTPFAEPVEFEASKMSKPPRHKAVFSKDDLK